MKIEIIRKNFEMFSEDISREFYLNGAGLKDSIDFQLVYDKYEGLFKAGNLDIVKDFLDKSGSDKDIKRNKMLLEAFYGEIIHQKNNKLHSMYLNRQTSGKINIAEKEEISYRNSTIRIFNEHCHDKREVIRKGTEEFIKTDLNPILKEIHLSEDDFSSEIGFDNRVDLFEFFSGINLSQLNNEMQNFLSQTEDLYIQLLKKAAKEKLDTHIQDLRLHDLTYLTKSNDFDMSFNTNELLDFAKLFLQNLGICIESGNIIFDMDKRMNKSSRAFCSPVRIPKEIYLVLYPKGGKTDYKTFLHELGHSLHYSNINPDLEFEYKRFGDNSVTEGFAMTMDHLMMNEKWLNKYFNINFTNNKKYFINEAFNELVILRRFAAKIEYEIKLNETSGIEGKKELYSTIFENTLKIKHSGENFLVDVDPYFYCARYLRA